MNGIRQILIDEPGYLDKLENAVRASIFGNGDGCAVPNNRSGGEPSCGCPTPERTDGTPGPDKATAKKEVNPAPGSSST
jgi:hypothetical protein